MFYNANDEPFNRRIYLDLDGVMADFDAHFPKLFNVDHKTLLDDDMWEIINSHRTFFAEMPMMPGAKEFFDAIRPLNPIILTACPKSDYENVAVQKRQWVAQHLDKTTTVLPMMHGRFKWLFMHQPGDILIDDFSKNIKNWSINKGVGILHKSFSQTWSELSDILKDDLGFDYEMVFNDDYKP